MRFSFVSVGGYAGTGGSLVRDLLRENSSIQFLYPAEFRLLSEHSGCLDLIKLLPNNRLIENHDLIIREFKKLVSNMAKSSKTWYLTTAGLDYSLHFSDFEKKCDDFIKSIVDYSYPNYWYYYDWLFGFYSQFYRRLRFKFGLQYKLNSSVVFKSRKELIELTSKFIDDLFSDFDPQMKVGLHNGVPITDYNEVVQCIQILRDVAIVIVDRDPRDIFLDLYDSRYLDKKASLESQVNQFIKFYNYQRRDKNKVSELPNVLILNFEDILSSHDRVVGQLRDFLDIDISENIDGDIFNVERSSKNMRLWSNYPELHDHLNRIYEECQ